MTCHPPCVAQTCQALFPSTLQCVEAWWRWWRWFCFSSCSCLLHPIASSCIILIHSDARGCITCCRTTWRFRAAAQCLAVLPQLEGENPRRRKPRPWHGTINLQCKLPITSLRSSEVKKSRSLGLIYTTSRRKKWQGRSCWLKHCSRYKVVSAHKKCFNRELASQCFSVPVSKLLRPPVADRRWSCTKLRCFLQTRISQLQNLYFRSVSHSEIELASGWIFLVHSLRIIESWCLHLSFYVSSCVGSWMIVLDVRK